MKLRLAIAAILAGVLSSIFRAPGGLDWTQAQLADAWTSAVFGAAVLVMLGMVLRLTRALDEAGPSIPWLLALFGIGHAGNSLSGWVNAPDSRFLFGAVFVVVSLAIVVLIRPRERRPAPDRRPLESVGWLLAGAGALVALTSLARRERLLTHGMPGEYGLVFGVALLLAALGARAFGVPLFARNSRVFGALALLGVPTASIAGAAFLGGLSPDTFERYLARFGFGPNAVGMLEGDALFAATTFVLPAFVGGAALVAAARASALPAVLFGAAIATLILPFAFSWDGTSLAPESFGESRHAWTFIAYGSGLAAAGALLIVFGPRTRPRAGRAALSGGLLALVALPVWIGPRPSAFSFSPWYLAPLTPRLVFEGALGLGTVEWSPGGAEIATLDRRRLTPVANEISNDRELFATSLALLEDGPARVLLVGQMTPDRDALLRARGDLTVERTAPWFDLLPAFEEALFENSSRPPLGERVEPREARSRIDEGAYDLVLALPIHGPLLRPRSVTLIPWGSAPAPVSGSLSVPEGTRGVLWTSVTTPNSRSWNGDGVLLAGGDWRSLAIGQLFGSKPDDELCFEVGDYIVPPTPFSRLRKLPRRVGDGNARANAERLESGTGEEGRLALTAEAIANFFRAQELSSPFESGADQVELNEDVPQRLLRATAESGPTPFLRNSWNWLAWILAQKRRPDLSLVYLEPLSRGFGPWPELDLVLAGAYHEFEMSDEEAAAYERVLEARGNDVTLWVRGAEAALRAGDWGTAVERFRTAVELQPRPEFDRALGLALLRDGRLEGRALLEAWLEGSPDDEEVRRALEEGVFPEIERSFMPTGGVDRF